MPDSSGHRKKRFVRKNPLAARKNHLSTPLKHDQNKRRFSQRHPGSARWEVGERIV